METQPTPWTCASKWYPDLAEHTFPMQFVPLRPEEIIALANGRSDAPEAAEVIQRIDAAMKRIPMLWRSFVFADSVAPTDTERFKLKGGAVVSAESAWRILCESGKVRLAVAGGHASMIGIKPYRPITQPREFRLFIQDGELKAMSQYWLNRHFRRLNADFVQEDYWNRAQKFIADIAWKLPVKTLVMDIYFTRQLEILIIDLNIWGLPTDPLLLRKWNIVWDPIPGLKLIPPPVQISGEVHVSP